MIQNISKYLSKLKNCTYKGKHFKTLILHTYPSPPYAQSNLKTMLHIFIYSLNTRMSGTGISIVGHYGTSHSSILDERRTLVRYNEHNKSIVHGRCLCNRTRFVRNVNVHLYTCSWCILLRTRRRHLLLSLRYCRPYTSNLRDARENKL